MRLALLCLLFFSASASAQTIYKCKGSGGRTVYQQMPCADEAATIEQRAVKLDVPSQEVSAAPDARTAMTRNVDMSRADEVTRRCINAASGSAYSSAEQRIRQLETDKARIQNQMRHANNNLAGAAWESGLRSQLGSLETAIATERSSADAMFNQARLRCEDDGLRRKEELRQRFEAEDRAREQRAQQAAADSDPSSNL